MSAPTERIEVLDVVRRILCSVVRDPREPHHVDPDAPIFASGLGLDSVDAVELVVEVQQALGVTIPEGAGTRAALRTPNTLVDLLLDLRGAP